MPENVAVVALGNLPLLTKEFLPPLKRRCLSLKLGLQLILHQRRGNVLVLRLASVFWRSKCRATTRNSLTQSLKGMVVGIA